MNRIPAWHRILPACGLALVGSCRSAANDNPGSTRLPSPAEQWVVADENDSLRVSIDTAGWIPDQSQAVLWIAVTDISSAEAKASDSPFLRFETRQEVDCRNERARGLDVRVPDSSGTWIIHPVGDSAWRPFATAGLDTSILAPVCAKLSELGTSGP